MLIFAMQFEQILLIVLVYVILEFQKISCYLKFHTRNFVLEIGLIMGLIVQSNTYLYTVGFF